MNFKSKIKWKSHKRTGKWNWKYDTEEGGEDGNRIRLHRPGSHRLLEMGKRFKAGTVLTGSVLHRHFPSLFFITSYTFNQTHVKTCLHVIKRSGTCSNRVSHWQRNSDDLTVWVFVSLLTLHCEFMECWNVIFTVNHNSSSDSTQLHFICCYWWGYNHMIMILSFFYGGNNPWASVVVGYC